MAYHFVSVHTLDFHSKQRLKGQKERSANTIKMILAGHVIKKSRCGCSINVRDACGYVENIAAQCCLFWVNEAGTALLSQQQPVHASRTEAMPSSYWKDSTVKAKTKGASPCIFFLN